MIWSKAWDDPYTNVAASSLWPALIASEVASPGSPEHRYARAAHHSTVCDMQILQPLLIVDARDVPGGLKVVGKADLVSGFI